MKYTKGPWTGTTTSGSSDDVCAYIIESKDRYIADVHVHTTDDGMVAQANANLIAAAPEMLEQLESVLGLITDNKMKSGVCLCGEVINRHSPHCKFRQIDSGIHNARKIRESITATLKKARGE